MTATGNTTDELGIRPLTARSVLLSTLLGVDPPELPASRLVATARLFGVEDGTARVALSRMVRAGEVVAVGGRYRLAGRLLERQRRQLTGRHPPPAGPWAGAWHVAVVTATGRSARQRAELRGALAGARLAEWREGVWVRPDNLRRPELPSALRDHVAWLDARPDDDPADVASQLWDLGPWATVARGLLDRLDATASALGEGDTAALASGFVLSAAVVRHLAADPLLPPRLLPGGWPGPALRAAYDAWDASYQRTLGDYHRRGSR